MPFGPDAIVYKVAGKMYALVAADGPRLTVKCDPDEALELRERYAAVHPGYHMSKRHWNTITWDDDDLPAGAVASWIRASYALVVAALPARTRAELQAPDCA